MFNLQDKRILLGVSGGIAAYKSPEIVRLIVKSGGSVKVLLTSAGAKFITPVTLETVSGNRVYSELFPPEGSYDPIHISLARWADALLIAPATADIIAKAACGIADSLLSTVLLAVEIPVLFCPSMNTSMLNHPAVRKNLQILSERGIHILEPDAGPLASLSEGSGVGRMPEPAKIVQWLADVLEPSGGVLEGLKILITAGPTVEEIDPVRFISNHSSGKMGFALARQAVRMGAEVTLIYGPVALTPPAEVRAIRISSAEEMLGAVSREFHKTDVAIMAAAVADYKPLARSLEKGKKRERLTLELVQNPDILRWMGANKKKQFVVGFALEDSLDLKAGRDKLKDKNADLIVLNSTKTLHSDENQAVLLTGDFEEELPLMDKNRLARELLDKIAFKIRQTGLGK